MQLVGARFDDAEAARAALRQLERIAHAPGDVGLRPLGSVRYEHPARGLVVAGRFAAEDVATVVEILERHEGVIVFNREEWREPSGGGRRSGHSGCARCVQITGRGR